MSGFFGVVSTSDFVKYVFFGADYHSHLGTQRGGIAVLDDTGFTRFIHDITNTQFRSKFDSDIGKLKGNRGLGIISDYEDQPILVSSHLGTYAIVTVGVIQNASDLIRKSFQKKSTHFSEVQANEVNPTEIVASLINEEDNFTDGLTHAMESIEGSCSILLLTGEGLYAARDKLGRTPIIIGKKEGAWAASSESCAFPNLNYETTAFLGPGEIVLIHEDGMERKKAPGERMQICAFLWVYYGYPSACYEDINVETVRYRCGASLARNDSVSADMAAGIPDSGTAHAIGYAVESGIPYGRPFVKYTPTWPRSFMPQNQQVRDMVARMKLIPIREIIAGKRLLFCEDSIVRGTQLQDIVQRIFDYGAKEVHMRPACPPLVFGCKYLNFSRSRSLMDLATRKAIHTLEGKNDAHLDDYANPRTERYEHMVNEIRKRLKLTTLRYQELGHLVECIGLPKEKLCTYCWDGCEINT